MEGWEGGVTLQALLGGIGSISQAEEEAGVVRDLGKGTPLALIFVSLTCN